MSALLRGRDPDSGRGESSSRSEEADGPVVDMRRRRLVLAAPGTAVPYVPLAYLPEAEEAAAAPRRSSRAIRKVPSYIPTSPAKMEQVKERRDRIQTNPLPAADTGVGLKYAKRVKGVRSSLRPHKPAGPAPTGLPCADCGLAEAKGTWRTHGPGDKHTPVTLCGRCFVQRRRAAVEWDIPPRCEICDNGDSQLWRYVLHKERGLFCNRCAMKYRYKPEIFLSEVIPASRARLPPGYVRPRIVRRIARIDKQ